HVRLIFILGVAMLVERDFIDDSAQGIDLGDVAVGPDRDRFALRGRARRDRRHVRRTRRGGRRSACRGGGIGRLRGALDGHRRAMFRLPAFPEEERRKREDDEENEALGIHGGASARLAQGTGSYPPGW